MRIDRVTDIQEILKCLPFEGEIRRKGRDTKRESDMILFIQSQLNNPLLGFWMAYDDTNNLIGYLIAMISLIPGMQRLVLLRIYAKSKELFKEFEGILINWAKQYKIKVALMTVSNSKLIKIIQRKYGWKIVSVNMERRYL